MFCIQKKEKKKKLLLLLIFRVLKYLSAEAEVGTVGGKGGRVLNYSWLYFLQESGKKKKTDENQLKEEFD